MLHELLVEHRKLESDYWWFVNKRRIVRRLLSRHRPNQGRVLDVGSGGGFLGAALREDGWDVVSVDVEPEAARFARGHGVTRALAFDANAGWPLADASFNAFLMLDVLEHIKDDAAALAEARRILSPGAIGIVSVPAYPWLYSAWDESNRHYRRYTKRALLHCAAAAGLACLSVTYWNAVSLPPALVLRLKDRFKGAQEKRAEFPRLPSAMNRGLIAYGLLEDLWLRNMRLPLGLSVIAVLQKKEETA